MTNLTDRIAQAIGDPGSIVGRRFGPSWGEGNDGYAPEPESVTRWSTRAVLAVLADGRPVAPSKLDTVEAQEALENDLLANPVARAACLRARYERGFAAGRAARDESNKGFDAAVDWLLNSAHTGDQDIQNAFWALADGLVTEDEVDTLSAAEIRQRRERAKVQATAPSR